MSLLSFGSEQESSPSAASQADSRPSSSSLRPSSSVGGSRPASAQSRRGHCIGGSLPPPSSRDPGLAHAEKLAKLSLEKLQQQDFIMGREAWGVSTPSTASCMSRASSSYEGSRPASSAASISSSCYSGSQGKDPNVKQQLKDAQARAKASMKALQSELKGSAASTPARYSAWPIGCAVRVALEGNSCEQDSLMASLVNYNSSSNAFEVKLEDGSTRTVSAERVTRARARDRATAQGKLVGQSPPCAAPAVQSSRSMGNLPVEGGLGFSGYQVQPPHSQRTHRQMSAHPPLAENGPWTPEPQMFGRVEHFVL